MGRKENSPAAHFLEHRSRTFRNIEIPAVDAARICRKVCGQALERDETEQQFPYMAGQVAEYVPIKLPGTGRIRLDTGMTQIRKHRIPFPAGNAKRPVSGTGKNSGANSAEKGHHRHNIPFFATIIYTMSENCLFCKIIKGEIPSKKIYEDDDVFAFYDIAPQAPVHFLVVPKRHIATIMDMKPEDCELVGKMLYRAQIIAKELGLEESGARFVFNCKADAGQTVFHIHLHVVGGQAMGWPPFPSK